MSNAYKLQNAIKATMQLDYLLCLYTRVTHEDIIYNYMISQYFPHKTPGYIASVQ